MDKVFSVSWSNRILYISFICVVVFSTIQSHITSLSVPLHILISWTIFVITLSIWLSCVALRLMLKVNAPFSVEPFNKWLKEWATDYEIQDSERYEAEKMKPEFLELESSDENSASNGISDRETDQNKNSPPSLMRKMNLEKIVDDIDTNFVKIWYENVSNDDAFPSEAKQLLRNLMKKFNYQLTRVNRIELARKIGNILLLHLKEYRR